MASQDSLEEFTKSLNDFINTEIDKMTLEEMSIRAEAYEFLKGED